MHYTLHIYSRTVKCSISLVSKLTLFKVHMYIYLELFTPMTLIYTHRMKPDLMISFPLTMKSFPPVISLVYQLDRISIRKCMSWSQLFYTYLFTDRLLKTHHCLVFLLLNRLHVYTVPSNKITWLPSKSLDFPFTFYPCKRLLSHC